MRPEPPEDTASSDVFTHNGGDPEVILVVPESSSKVTTQPSPAETPTAEHHGADEQSLNKAPSRSSRELRLGVVYSGGSVLVKTLATLITALLAAGLLTIEWDGYQREAEARARLVSDITTSVARAKVSAHFIAAGVYGIEAQKDGVNIARIKQEYNKRRWDWENDAARISAQLGAYFEDRDSGQDWQDFWDAMSDYFELSYPRPVSKDLAQRRHDPRSRRELLNRIAKYLKRSKSRHAIGPMQRKILERRSSGDLAEYYGTYRGLGRKLLPEQNKLTKQILTEPTEVGPPIGLVRGAKAVVSWIKAKF